jgi:hypothetical protein
LSNSRSRSEKHFAVLSSHHNLTGQCPLALSWRENHYEPVIPPCALASTQEAETALVSTSPR